MVRPHLSPFRRAFTVIEVIVVVLMIGILAAIVVPQFGGVTNDAKSGAAQGALAGVRSGIAGFRSKAILAGTSPFPTLTQLTTTGTVLQSAMPQNPYNKLSSVQTVTLAQATARTVVGTTSGWNYYVDNTASPPVAIFYANSSTVTTVSNGSGGYKTANQLRPTRILKGGTLPQRCDHHDCRRTRAFTLVEMSVVVIITGIVAATVVPAWNSLTGTRQAAAAEEVERKIVAARSQALAEGRPVGVRVDPVNDTVQTFVIASVGAAPSVATMVDGQADSSLYIPGAYSGSEITSLTAGNGTTTAQVLWFGYDGSPQLRDGTTGTLIGPWTQDAVIVMPGGQQVLVRKVSGLVQR